MIMQRIYFTILFIFAFALTSFGQWKQISNSGIPDSFGGNAQCIATDGTNVFVGLKDRGVFVSSDNGENWTDANTGLDVTSVYAICLHDNYVYIALNRKGVYRSPVDNINWEELIGGKDLPTDKNYTSLAILDNTLFLGTYGEYIYQTDLTTIDWVQNKSELHSKVSCLVADANTNRVYAGTDDKNNISVYEDGAWQKFSYTIDSKIRSLAIKDNHIFLGAENGLYVSDFVVPGYSVTKLTSIPEEKILSLAVSDNTLFAGVFGYSGSGPGIYKGDIDLDNTMNFEKIFNGITSPKPIVRGMGATSSEVWLAVEGEGPYKSNVDFTGWEFKANGIPLPTSINKIIEKDSKLYALTSIGVFESASGKGGDWSIYSLSGINVGEFIFAESGSEYAIANGQLYQNGALVVYDTGDNYPLGPDLVGLNSLFEYIDTNTGTAYIFVGSWAAGVDGYAGVYRTSDDGATWDRYGVTTTEENTTGMHENNRILATSWAASSDGKIYTTGKHVIQITEDFGDTYYWRKGDNNMPSWGTTTNMVVRTYNDVEYLFMGMEDYWYIGRTPIGDDVAMVWERADGNENGNKAPKRPYLTDYSEHLLFARERSGTRIVKTEDNGDNWYDFTTGIADKSGLESITTGTGYIYLAGKDKAIYRYDMTTPPAWSEAPTVKNISYTTAEMEMKSTRAGTVHYVVLNSDATQPTKEQIKAGKDADGNNAMISGAIVLDENTQECSAGLGNLSPATSYKIYAFIRSEVLLESDIQSADLTTLDAPDITFSVTDGSNPVEDAAVEFHSTEILTGTNGLAVFEDISPGDGMMYSVKKDGFLTVEGSLDVSVTETVDVVLVPVYEVTFTITENDTPVQGVNINFGGIDALTDTDGKAVFSDIQAADDMPYTVSKETYITLTGTLNIPENVDIPLSIEKEPVCATPINPVTDDVTDSNATLQWSAGEGTIEPISYSVWYRTVDEADWTETSSTTPELNLTELTEGTEYEWQVQTVCTEGTEDWSTSEWMHGANFRTESNMDCTGSVPENPVTLNITSSSVLLSWDNINGVSSFDVQYRKKGAATWQQENSVTNSTTISSLEEQTIYEWQVRSVCEATATQSDWTAIVEFTTSESGTPVGGAGLNPIAQYYSGDNGYPTWTDRIKWENRMDMSEYANGDNDFEKFENARDELYAQGGGVLYYPEGTYDFTDAPVEDPNGRGLMLKKGVVILGDVPEGDVDAKDGTLELKTKFIFKFIEKGGGEVPAPWNIIGLMPDGEELKDVNDVGIAWVQVEGATVFWGYQMEMGQTYGTADAWLSSKIKPAWESRKPDGTYPMDAFCGQKEKYTSEYQGAGSGRFVFGCQFDNAIVLNDVYDRGFGAEGFSEYKYGGRIAVYGSHVFIANNVISKSTKSFLYNQLTSEGEKTIIFDYGFATGIDVNKNNVNVVGNRLSDVSGYFEPGVVVIDNWIYNHGFKTMDGSGNWVTIRNNFAARDKLGPGEETYGLGTEWTLTGDGYKTHADIGSSDAFQTRGYDLAGKNMWIDGNYYEKVGTKYPSNDGEGILAQRHGGTDIMSWAITNNIGKPDGYRPGYIGGYDVHNYGCMIAWNTTGGSVGHIKAMSNNVVDASFVDNIASEVKTDCGGTCDYITECPTGDLTPPTDVNVTVDKDNYCIEITWTDAGDEEIGFRVERLIDGSDTWTPIAYRPRHSNGTEYNEQKWVDYLAPAGKALEYRVVSVNCENNDEGASQATAPVLIPVKVANPVFSKDAGAYNQVIQVLLTSTTEGAVIRYTTDGSDPDESATEYTEAIIVNETTTIKARAFKGENIPSDIIEMAYTIDLPQVATPEFSVSEGTYNSAQTVTITSATEGAEIHYTTDGSEPNESSPVFDSSTPLTIEATTTVKAIAYKDGMDVSEIAAVTYTITGIEFSQWLNDLKLYPNPTRQKVRLSMESDVNGELHIRILDPLGHAIMEYSCNKQTSSFSKEIDVSNLNAGVYYFEIRMNNYKTVRMLMKQ